MVRGAPIGLLIFRRNVWSISSVPANNLTSFNERQSDLLSLWAPVLTTSVKRSSVQNHTCGTGLSMWFPHLKSKALMCVMAWRLIVKG